VLSPWRPPNTTSSVPSDGSTPVGALAMKSFPPRNVLPSTVIVERSLNARRIIGTFWKNVPLSPAGCSPSRCSSDAMYAVVFFPSHVLSLYEMLARRVAPKLEEKGRVAVSAIIHGLSVLRQPSRFASVFGWTLAHWLCNALAFWIGFRAFGIMVPFSAALFLQGLVAIGVAAPQMPGFFGVFELFGQVGLGLYGVPSDTAVAWAITYHALSFIPITLIGAWYFVRAGLSIGELSGAERTETTNVDPDSDARASASVASES